MPRISCTLSLATAPCQETSETGSSTCSYYSNSIHEAVKTRFACQNHYHLEYTGLMLRVESVLIALVAPLIMMDSQHAPKNSRGRNLTLGPSSAFSGRRRRAVESEVQKASIGQTNLGMSKSRFIYICTKASRMFRQCVMQAREGRAKITWRNEPTV